MKVMVMVKASKDSEAGKMPSTELLTAMGKFNEELVNAGILLAAEGLRPSSSGARVHFKGKDRIVTDGPFAETKELVAGYWLWRVKSLDEAIEWVKKCPNPMAEDSDIDIRPIFETEDFGAELNSELRERGAALRAKTVGLNLPTFQDGPELLIAGLSRRYTSESRVAIPRQWEDFVPRAAELSPSPGASWFGVCSNCAPDDSFDYLTGVELAEARSIPHGLTSLQLAPRRYVVFAHTGHVSTMPKTIDVIWKQWAPECGLKIARNGPCVERYTSEFNPQTGMGGMEIWIPLEA